MQKIHHSLLIRTHSIWFHKLKLATAPACLLALMFSELLASHIDSFTPRITHSGSHLLITNQCSIIKYLLTSSSRHFSVQKFPEALFRVVIWKDNHLSTTLSAIPVTFCHCNMVQL